MYEILKKFNENTFLALDGTNVYILKKIGFEDVGLYRSLSNTESRYAARVFGTTIIENGVFAVCEYINGITLEEYVSLRGFLEDDEVRRIASNICDGLKCIHKNGVVHRDITPNNIIITNDGDAKIIDFGISRIIKENVSSDTQILGTHGYAAPEQFGFHQTGERADIYAVGVLINFMKTGCLPGEKLTDGALRPIVEKCIEMDEKKRFKSAENLSDALMHRKIKNKIAFSGMLYALPGIIRGNAVATIISAAYYALCSVFFLIVDTSNMKNAACEWVSLFFVFVVPYYILWDIGGWTGKLGFKNLDKAYKRWIVRVCGAIVAFFIGGIIMSIIAPSNVA